MGGKPFYKINILLKLMMSIASAIKSIFFYSIHWEICTFIVGIFLTEKQQSLATK